MTYGAPMTDEAQPICPSCGVTMHPLLDEGIGADECRECGYQMPWSASAPADDEGDVDVDVDDERDTRWD